jgi:hypothetical protein
MPRTARICCGWARCPRPGSRHRRYARTASWCAINTSCAGCVRGSRPARTRCWPSFGLRLDSQLRLIDTIEQEIDELDKRIRAIADDLGYRALLRLPGVGPVFTAILCVEIGEITRFPSQRWLNSWAGLTPRTGSSRCGPAPHTRRALKTDQRPPTHTTAREGHLRHELLLRRHSPRRTSASMSRASGR